MNNIVRYRLGYRYPSLSLSFLHFLHTALYLFPLRSKRQGKFVCLLSHTRFEQEEFDMLRDVEDVAVYIFQVSESLVLSRSFLSFQKNR